MPTPPDNVPPFLWLALLLAAALGAALIAAAIAVEQAAASCLF